MRRAKAIVAVAARVAARAVATEPEIFGEIQGHLHKTGGMTVGIGVTNPRAEPSQTP